MGQPRQHTTGRTSGLSSYDDCTDLTGPLPVAGGPDVVQFRRTLRGHERWTLHLLVTLGVLTHLVFLGWLAAPRHWVETFQGKAPLMGALALTCFAAVVVVEIIRTVQALSLWVFSLAAKDPIPMAVPAGLRVAVLTTIVPAVEPVAMVRRTLAAMRQVRYTGGTVDVWILDEGDDPTVRAVAAELGVRHFSRHGDPGLNTPTGRFRARTKAGNHNAWFSRFGTDYDVVAQLDPDHVPGPHFLERTLGYFRDPDIAFVVAPQVYGDALDSFPGHGAAAQAYLFHGVIQRGGNGLGAPLLIGTNHVFRAETWAQIGGYQDCIIEDHLTSMTVHGNLNPTTQHRWKGVYTPDVLAIGQAPKTWGDLFLQQRRWAQGAAEIALKHSARLGRRLRPSQRVAYALLQAFYPSVVLSWVLGIFVTVALLAGAPIFGPANSWWWAVLWATSVTSTLVLLLWERRLNLGRTEQRESGIHGMVTTLCTAPVYTAAVMSALLRQPLSYRVTPKAGAATGQTWEGFRQHLRWFAVLAAAVLVGALGYRGTPVPWIWAVLALAACAAPPIAQAVSINAARVPAGPRPSWIRGAPRRSRQPHRPTRR